MSSLLRQELEKSESPCQEESKDEEEKVKEDEKEENATYIVQKGDTLMHISLVTNVSIPALKKYNRLYGRNSLYAGQVIKLTDPALQPSVWKDCSDGISDKTVITSPSVWKKMNEANPSDDNLESFITLKDMTEKQVSFIEKERLKSKPITPRNINISPSSQSRDMSSPTDETIPFPNLYRETSSSPRVGDLKTKSSSFKYKCNSHPDLTSMVEQSSSVPDKQGECSRKRRQSLFRDVIPGLFSHRNTHSDIVSPLDSQSTPECDPSISFASVPKTLWHGTLNILDSYFPGSFTPTPNGLFSKADDSIDLLNNKSDAVRNFLSFHTRLHGNSSILLHSHIQCLVEHFPTSIQHDEWDLLYSTQLHGSDLTSFYHRSKVSTYSLIVVRTEDNQVFGGFASETWKMCRYGREAFYGTGESFLFKCHPFSEADLEEDNPNCENVDVYVWQYDNYFFQWSNPKQIAMGGGGGHFGFVLDDDFSFAETNPCETYGNPYLTSHRDPFRVLEVELWGFGCSSSMQTLDESNRSRENDYIMSYES